MESNEKELEERMANLEKKMKVIDHEHLWIWQTVDKTMYMVAGILLGVIVLATVAMIKMVIG